MVGHDNELGAGLTIPQPNVQRRAVRPVVQLEVSITVQLLLLQQFKAIAIEKDLEPIATACFRVDRDELRSYGIVVSLEVIGADFAEADDVVAI